MTRRVVRVSVPQILEYDVVFEDGEPIFVGAVIRRAASKSGPNAGKTVDTHRTSWDGRGGPKSSLVDDLISQAAEALRGEIPPPDRPMPSLVDRPFFERVIGSPHESSRQQIMRARYGGKFSWGP